MLIKRDVFKTFYNALVQKMKDFRGNWDQNDPTADDYIKNRPFYSAGYDEIVILENTKAIITSNNGNTVINYSPIIPFEAGQTYTVIWDGISYECESFVVDRLASVGNVALFGGPDTGEPFLIAIDKNMFGGAYVAAISIGEHDLSIIRAVEKVVKIDKKYLPDLPTMDYVSYNEFQDLTEDQMALARENIGAGTSSFSGSYTDLKNKPTIYSDVIRHDINQSLTDTQKLRAKANIGIGNFDGSFDSLTGKPDTDTVRYGSQSLSTDQKKQARENIGASDFSGRYVDLTDAPEYDPSYDRMHLTALETERVTIYDDSDGDKKTTPFSSFYPTTWQCNPDGQDGSKTSSINFGFSKRDGDDILQALYMKSDGSIITSRDIQFSGIAAPTADNDVVNKAYVDELTSNLVSYNSQTLTDEQKSQARANIGAGTSNFGGSWNDLEDKPFGNTATKGEVIMTTVNVPVFTGEYYSCNPTKSTFPNQNEGAINMVEFDGKEYVCPVEIRNINNPARWQFIAGNAHLMDSTSEDNGMPFCVYFARGSAGHKIYVTDNTTTHVVTVYSCTSGIEQIDEKFIPDTIARVEDFTILPIKRIEDFGVSYERRINGSICTHTIYLTNAMAGIDDYIFKVQIPEGCSLQDVKLRYMNPDGSVSIPKGLSSLTNTIYLWFSIDANRDRAVAHELLSDKEWRFTYDVNGAYVNDTITFNITSDNLITQFNSLSIVSSYVPSLVTDVATKGYVDSAIPEIATDDEILELLAQEDMFPVVMDSDGSILADENENILLW